ncbi:MAG: GMC family oxidoreductase [Deltaproteobacteria bacterium]|nr:GMC family oxidoreductase [Deltaproteobacteria bacterium]MBW2213009.1 GMC family oxidoreductase [Deltaproteobacteria bacterium]MBW2550074.1 GMC family oxidoreductase [Deltaproteobacteria bacterium]MBW2626743.1 GMC family oxidoreductase [Deltaproteobacteria bacterium]
MAGLLETVHPKIVMNEYDYIVVGGGSAGCIVAAELANDPSNSVLLLESGPAAEEHPETLIAEGYKEAFINDAVMGERFSIPQVHSAKHRIFAGTGTVMGGSGSVNGMVYTRGSREDYAEWPQGWHWNDVQEDFKAIEKRLRPHRRPATKWTEACIASAQELGFNRKEDLNDGNMSNVIGYEWMSYEGEDRRSSYVAFVKDAGERANLTVLTGARAHRVMFTPEKRARAVEFEHDGALKRAASAKEIILCAGALETPKLLMLSGVGPSEHLRTFDIPVVTDRPAIGNGLHDHPNVPVFFKAKKDIDCFYPQLYSFFRTNEGSDLPASQSDTCYVYWPAPSAMRQMVQRMLPPMVVPHAFYGPRSRQMVRGMIGAAFKIGAVQQFTDHMFGIILILGKPKSRGTLRLQSTDVSVQALIDPAYYSDSQDMDTMVRGVRIARAIGGASGLAGWGAKELMPGKHVNSDAAIANYVRKNTITTYHFAGSCRMGTSETDPVDAQLRLRGVSGLRVADASAIPWTPVSALNAPSMLIGYRAAKLIRSA